MLLRSTARPIRGQLGLGLHRKAFFSNVSQQRANRQLWRPARRRKASVIGNQQFRQASSMATWKMMWRQSMRTHPISTPIVATLIGGLAIFAVSFIALSTIWVTKKYGRYPDKVGLKLRRGIFYTDVRPDPERANIAFFEALQYAREAGMDKYSDEVIGISTEWARCIEKLGYIEPAIDILNRAQAVLMDWIEEYDSGKNRNAEEGKEDPRRRRTRLLKKACEISTKLGELYTYDEVGDPKRSEECLVWAVETTLRERQRRQIEGVKEAEGDWMDEDQHGSQLEALGHVYEGRDQHFFAAQLFLQALLVKPEKDCHTVILMNNLAASMAQQIVPPQPGVPPPSRAELRESARSWAKKALELASTIKPPTRNEECDMGCVVATHNLGEFAEMDGNVSEARSRYLEAGSIAHAIGFEAGVVSAEEGLRRLDGRNTKSKRQGWW